ncbi:MAG TPA: hypothetical protein VK879_07130 [Candidatus Sulfomarinibacteraceae bacterium]|nr:hypothetical protein [Candidatus Sulfomarinibacteraceae bacterium]
MPKLSRWFIKAGLIYFVLALLVGLLLAGAGFIQLPSLVNGLTPVYFHLFMVGWITQLIFGVANWMFPIFNREEPRGNETLGWTTFLLLNVGLILRGISEPMLMTDNITLWGTVMTVSALLLSAAGALFVANTWNRVKGR